MKIIIDELINSGAKTKNKKLIFINRYYRKIVNVIESYNVYQTMYNA